MRLTEPSKRNWEVFQAIEYEGASLRAVARKFQISPTRVTQIVEQVRHWYTETTPAWVFERRSEVQPLVACRMHETKLYHLERRLHRSWRKSLKGEQTMRQVEGEMRKVIVTRYRHGDIRFLMAIIKVSQARISACERTHGAMQEFEANYGSAREAILSLRDKEDDELEEENDNTPNETADDVVDAQATDAQENESYALPIADDVAPNPCAPVEDERAPVAPEPAVVPLLTPDDTMTSEDFVAMALMRRAMEQSCETPVRAAEPKRLSRQARQALKRARKRRKVAS